MSIALAIVSENLDLTKFGFQLAQNTNLYNIKSKSSDLDYYINLREDKDCAEMFNNILLHVCKERNIKNLPTLEELQQNDGLALRKFLDVMNSFLYRSAADSGKNVQQLKDYSRIQTTLEELSKHSLNANMLNQEAFVLSEVRFLINHMIFEKFNSFERTSQDELLTYLSASNMYNAHTNNFFAKEYNWIFEPKETNPSPDFDKQIAELLTLCLLSTDVRTSISFNNQLDNTIEIKAKINNNENQLFLHDRVSAQNDFEKFKTSVYDEILLENGYNSDNSMTNEGKDETVFDIIKSKADVPKTYLNFYKDCLVDGKMNYGRDRKIMGAVALNIISILGKDTHVANLSNIRSQSNGKLRNAFRQNYDLISGNPSIALQIINKIMTEDKRNTSSMDNELDINDLFERMCKGANIHIVDANNLDELPPEIRGIVEDVIKEIGNRQSGNIDDILNDDENEEDTEFGDSELY